LSAVGPVRDISLLLPYGTLVPTQAQGYRSALWRNALPLSALVKDVGINLGRSNWSCSRRTCITHIASWIELIYILVSHYVHENYTLKGAQ